MGKRKQKKTRDGQFDSSDDESLSSTSTAFYDMNLTEEMLIADSLESMLVNYLDALYEKRSSTREKALMGLLNSFEGNVLVDFIETRYFTLLHQYLNSIKRGSTKEICLATRAIGFLAITAGIGESTQEILKDSMPHLSRALISGNNEVRISVLDCLGIISFIGSHNWDDTEMETTMKIIWDFIRPKSLSMAETKTKFSSAVLIRALSTWSFLVTTSRFRVYNLDMWTEIILFLYNLLEKGDRAVRIAAGEAIVVTFEVVITRKLISLRSDEIPDDFLSKPQWIILQSLKEKIISLILELSMEAGGKGINKKCLNEQRDTFKKIYDYFKEGEHPNTSLKLSKKQMVLTTSTWSELIQLNFLKQFLGSGFLKHAEENELLHDLFNFASNTENGLSSSEKRDYRSLGGRERTQALRKDRQMAQFRKCAFIFSGED